MDRQYFINLSRNRLYNLHTHTQFCDGRTDMASFAEEGARLGFKALGFTPHGPVDIPSPCNMARENVEAYFAEVKRLRKLYKKGPELLVSMEVDFLLGKSGPRDTYYQDLGLDYILGSVHFLKSRHDGFIDVDGRPADFIRRLHDFFANDIRYVVSSYFESMAEMIMAGGFDIIGHLDKIAFNASSVQPGIEDEPWFADMVNAVIDEALKSGKFIEINTKAYERDGRFFPSERYWQRLVDGGANLLVNSDAHYADRLESGRPRAFEILGKLGYATAAGTVERHPWEPFLPQGAKALVMGTFPPGAHRWKMDFYYPNATNDFWKMVGLIFDGNPNRYYDPQKREYHVNDIKSMLSARGIAMSDTVKTARRLKDNASDKFLDVVEPNDVKALLRRMPQCTQIGCTGEKAAQIAASQLGVEAPAVGAAVEASFEGRSIGLWRLPSTSRAYPLSLELKADAYRPFFKAAECL